MFDPKRYQERLRVIKYNLRSFANTRCTGPKALLEHDDLLEQCIAPALAAYDEELGALAADRDAWAKRATP